MQNDAAVLFDFAEKVFVATKDESVKQTCSTIMSTFVTDRLEEKSCRLMFIGLPALLHWRSLISLHRIVSGSAEALLVIDMNMQKNTVVAATTNLTSYIVDATVMEALLPTDMREPLLIWMKANNALISGSSVLQKITSDNFEQYDVDIVLRTSKGNSYNLFTEMQKVLESRWYNSCCHFRTDDNSSITNVGYLFCKNGTTIKFHFTIIDPVDEIKKFDLNILQNYWDPKEPAHIQSFYLEDILKRQAKFVNTHENSANSIQKYEQRGYTFASM